MNHPEHICRFNDEPQTCECYDAGYAAGIEAEKMRVLNRFKEIREAASLPTEDDE